MGDCQAQGSKRIQLGLGPRLTLPSLRKLLLPHGLSLRCVTVVSVSVSDQMPSSLPCLSHVFRLSVALCLPLSVYASLCVCGSVCVCVCVCKSVCLPLSIFESVSEPWSLSGPVSPDTGPPIPSSGPGLSQVL